MALQLRRAKTDWSGCCQMAVQGTLWLAKCLSLNLNFSFLNRISLLLNQIATQLSSRGWVDPVPDHILPEKFLGQESNPGPLAWQSDMLTTIPNRRSINKSMALQPRSDCCQMAVQGALWLAKHLSLNLIFSFLNRISLIISSYPVVLTRLGGPRSSPYTSRKISRV